MASLAIGRGFGPNLTAGTGAVFHRHFLPQHLGQFGRHLARHGIGPSAGWAGDDWAYLNIQLCSPLLDFISQGLPYGVKNR